MHAAHLFNLLQNLVTLKLAEQHLNQAKKKTTKTEKFIISSCCRILHQYEVISSRSAQMDYSLCYSV